jgi:putative addiction module component (TIGR02574 family)
MRSLLDDLDDVAMALSNEDRIELAGRLLTSVNFDPKIRKMWMEEAERRLQRLESGEDPGLTLEEFFRDDP